MTAAKGALLAAVVAVVSVWVLYRLLRGRPIVARGAVLLRALAVASAIAVAISPRLPARAQLDAGSASAASEAFPSDLGERALGRQVRGRDRLLGLWRVLDAADAPGLTTAAREALLADASLFARDLRGSGEWRALGSSLAGVLEHVRAGQRDTRAELAQLLDDAEHTPCYDARLAALVWRRAGDVAMTAAERAALSARIGRHLRVTEALARAEQQVGPPTFVPWRKMSAPPRGYTGIGMPVGLVAAARQSYAAMSASAWERAGAIELVVGGAGGRVYRRGVASALVEGDRVRFGRLDVVEAGAGDLALRHDRVGVFMVRAGDSVHARALAGLLDPTRHRDVRALVTEASRGDLRALAVIESALPATHEALRAELFAHPRSRGASRLRTLLTLFDE